MQYIYIGANRLKDGLKQYTVYEDKPEKIIAASKEKFPLIDNLFIPANKLNEASMELNRKGTLLNEAYKQTGGAA